MVKSSAKRRTRSGAAKGLVLPSSGGASGVVDGGASLGVGAGLPFGMMVCETEQACPAKASMSASKQSWAFKIGFSIW